eukprot:TRINITY_DN14850_c0_g1_i1.p1 TRINITY_DN14850_c0_g1~~TRINITY_DN14850_c0_g1_i1.p1  ORF type:complete len:380 (+),score=95.21 TRINITY_DN14850_c0_g1_i1:363-1502(+)
MHGDHSKPIFGPSWLNKPRVSSPIEGGVDSKDINGKGTVNYNGKKVPLMFARSRSSPVLPVEEEQEPVKKTEGDFSILNGFESNFPSLGSNSKANLNLSDGQPLSRSMPQTSKTTKPESGPNSAWKSGQNKATPLNPSLTNPQSQTNTLQATPAVTDTDIQLASCVVPTLQAVPKILAKNKVELLKKGPPSRKKMEKAPSDTCLPIPAAYQEKYAKLKADKQKSSGTVVLNRSDFFKGKNEDSAGHRRGGSIDSINGFGQTPVPSPIFGSSGQMQENNGNSETVKAEGKAIESEQSNIDSGSEVHRMDPLQHEEEKFLRGLGWVPEEEDHVPELSPDEIVDKTPKLNRQHHDQYKKNLQSSFHVSIQKWQTYRLFGPQE